MTLSPEQITSAVNKSYSDRAQTGSDPTHAATVASAVGYTSEQLVSLPQGSNLGLSCGNPVAIANIQQGEVVLDLGSGGGLDVFLAADKVGPTGMAVGLDGSLDMLALARRNAKAKGVKPPHVAFVYASLGEEFPIESSSVDCILSNCVVNLLPPPGKASVFKEAYRVLKPQGRIHLADVVAKRDLPDEVKNDLTSYVDCVSGALTKPEYEKLLQDAGFTDITLTEVGAFGNPAKECCDNTSCNTGIADKKQAFNVQEFVASYQIIALKPSTVVEPTSTSVLKRWWDAYPVVRSSPDGMTADEVATLMRDSTKSLKDIAVVDVRRNDHTGGHVRGSFQCPAQTFCGDVQNYFERFKDTSKVIFYCQSSHGRGPRCAGWYQDYLDSVGHSSSKAYVLTGGIKGWMEKFAGQDDLVDYD